MSSDEDVIIDHNPPESEHPQVLTNNNQPALWNLASYVWSIFEGHGYLLVIGAVLTYYIYQRSVGYLEQKVQSKKSGGNNLSPEEQMNRLEGMRKAREKLQAEVDKAAAIEAEKIREREERQRQEKIEDWERHKKGLGYKNKTKAAEPTASSTLKPDNFSPLAGHGGSGGSFRSGRPSFSRGGGG